MVKLSHFPSSAPQKMREGTEGPACVGETGNQSGVLQYKDFWDGPRAPAGVISSFNVGSLSPSYESKESKTSREVAGVYIHMNTRSQQPVQICAGSRNFLIKAAIATK